MKESRDESKGTHSRLHGVLFLCGLIIAFSGVLIMRENSLINSDTLKFFEPFQNIISNYQEVLLGGALALLGAFMAAVSVKRFLPDKLGSADLPPAYLKSDLTGYLVLASGTICMALVYWCLFAGKYSHWVVGLFLLGLLLIGFAIRRLTFPPQRALELEINWLDISTIAILLMLTIGINLIGLTSWKFSIIGDEGVFFHYAKNIAEGKDWNFFHLRGVYEMFPDLESAYAALIMKIFGINVIGWRLSVIFVTAAASIMIYMLCKLLFGRLAAFAAGMVVATNHYLIAFNHIAYNTTNAIIFPIGTLLTLLIFLRTRNIIYAYLSGLILGFAQYASPLARFTWILAAIWIMIIFLMHPSVKRVSTILIMLFGFALVVAPTLINAPVEFYSFLWKFQTQYESISLFGRLIAAAQSFLIFWTNPGWYHHYVGSPLIDPLTGVLLVAGLIIAILNWRKMAARLALAWFIISVILLGITNKTLAPPITRLLFVIPAVALLVGLAVITFYFGLHRWFHLNTSTATIVIVATLLVMPGLNLHEFIVEGPKHTQPEGHLSFGIKALQDHSSNIIVEVSDWDNADQNFIFLLEQYPWLKNNYKYVKMDNLNRSLNSATSDLPIYFVRPNNDKIALELSNILPDFYHLQRDFDQNGVARSWLFIPMNRT